MFASPIEAYASVEHSAIRGMYVDPDRLDRSLERSIKIIQIKVCKNLPLKFPQKMAANPKETTAIIRENAADHALRPLFMRFEWTRCPRCYQIERVVETVTAKPRKHAHPPRVVYCAIYATLTDFTNYRVGNHFACLFITHRHVYSIMTDK